jgi:hypothetical protein
VAISSNGNDNSDVFGPTRTANSRQSLHTDFKLGGSGDTGARNAGQGDQPAVCAHVSTDISYGYVMTGAVTILVAPDADARALVPPTDIGTSWRLAGFTDSTWASGTLGMGFDTSGRYAPAIGLNLQTAMLNVNASAYLEHRFPWRSGAFNSLTFSALR